MLTLGIIITLLIIGVLFYHQIALSKSSLLLIGWTLFLSVVSIWSGWMLVLALLVLIPLNSKGIRQKRISRTVMDKFRQLLPAMSVTEKEAIQAGTTWWEGDLFSGRPDWHKLHQYTEPQLTAEELAFLNGPVAEACSMAADFQITHQLADLPPELWAFLRKHRFFAMIIKKEYGGLEFSAYAQSLVLQKLSAISGVLSITVGVPNSLGPGELLQHYGTDQQKQHYLPRLASGEEIPCFALTSPEAGSDAGAIPDKGIVCRGQWQGKEITGMRLTWNKRYITLAPIATVLGLAFKLYDPEKLLGDNTAPGITCALIPVNTPGVKIGRRHFPLNVPFQNGPTQGDGVFVPLDYIIGGASMAGQGWRMLVECLSTGRGITLPSNATGSLKGIALTIGAYAHIRRQFRVPIGSMEGIEEPLARIAGNAYVLDAASSLITYGIVQGEKPAVLSAIVKYHCTHRAQRCIIDAMDIAGGKGIMLGHSNFLARAYQGAPIAVTVEGANILTRSMIIFGQGAIRCHPYLLTEMSAVASDNLVDFDKALFSHIGHTIGNLFSSLWLGITRGYTSQSPVQDETQRHYQHLNRLSANLALLADVSMAVLGGGLKRRERLSARLGDVLSQLYLASATLKRYHDEGRHKEDLTLVHWGVNDAIYQAEEAISELLDNFPQPLIAGCLRVLIFPTGRHSKKSSDKLDRQLATLLQNPNPTRSRLGRGLHLEPSAFNITGQAEQALSLIIKAENIIEQVAETQQRSISFVRLDKLAEKGLQQQWLTEDQAAVLKQAEQSRMAMINVDDFDESEIRPEKAMPATTSLPTTSTQST